MAPRSNDMGSVYKNEKRGRWEAKYVVGRNSNGSPKRKLVTAKTRREVEDRLRQAIEARDQGLPPPDPTTTFRQFSEWWRDNALPNEGLAPATVAGYTYALDRYVNPRIGDRKLSGPTALTVQDIDAMCAGIMNERTNPKPGGPEGRSHLTAHAARVVVSKVLAVAQQHGRIVRNVARIAKTPRSAGKARKLKAFTVTQVAELLKGLDADPAEERERSRWYPVTVVGLTTGLRPAEVLALHWPDLHMDGDEPHLSVRHALSYIGGTTLKAPKRDRSYRTVPLAPEAVAALSAWRKVQAAERLAAGELWSPDWPNLVFARPDGTPSRVDTWRHALADAMVGAHPHRCRHTYATHLLEAGTPIHHVAELLGDSVSTVEMTYSHVIRRKHEVTSLVSGLVAT